MSIDTDARALVDIVAGNPFGWLCDDIVSAFPNAAPEWNGTVYLPWIDGGIVVDEYFDDDDVRVYRVGIYPIVNDEWGDPLDIVDTVDPLACAALMHLLTSYMPEAVSWPDWATMYVTDVWPDDPLSRGGIAAARFLITRP